MEEAADGAAVRCGLCIGRARGIIVVGCQAGAAGEVACLLHGAAVPTKPVTG